MGLADELQAYPPPYVPPMQGGGLASTLPMGPPMPPPAPGPPGSALGLSSPDMPSSGPTFSGPSTPPMLPAAQASPSPALGGFMALAHMALAQEQPPPAAPAPPKTVYDLAAEQAHARLAARDGGAPGGPAVANPAPLYRPPPQAAPDGGGLRPILGATPGAGGAAAGPVKPDAVAKDLDAKEQLVKDEQLGAAMGGAAVEGLRNDRAAKKEQFATEDADRAERTLADQQADIQEIKQLNENASQFKIDPNRWVNSQTLFQKLALIVAAGTKGASMAILHEGGQNPIMADINSSIERDIASQQHDYEVLRQKGVDAQNAYRMNLEATGNHDKAVAATHAQILDAAADKIDALSGSVQNAETQSKLAQAAQDIRIQRDQYLQKLQASAAGAGAAQQKALAEKISTLTADYVKSGKFASLQDAQKAATQTAMNLEGGSMPLAGIKGTGADAATDPRLSAGLERLGQQAVQGSMGGGLLPAGTERAQAHEAALSYNSVVNQVFEGMGYGHRDLEDVAKQYHMDPDKSATYNMHKMALFRYARDNGLIRPKLKGAASSEPDEGDK